MAFAGTVLPSQRDVELSQALFAFPIPVGCLFWQNASRLPRSFKKRAHREAGRGRSGLNFDPPRTNTKRILVEVYLNVRALYTFQTKIEVTMHRGNESPPLFEKMSSAECR